MPTTSPQQSYLHLNPAIEKLSEGKHVFGVSTSDFSLQNARSLARDPDIDFVYLDMEHSAMRFDQLEIFLSCMTDKAGILERGNAQAHPAVFARFAPYASEEAQWVVKHALDLGLMGILINNVETPEQAENIVRTMRYMPARDSKIPNPRGVRGTAGAAPWFWGISGAEYRQRADLWPLNPEGDLLFWPMIETVEGVKNADAIAQVPRRWGFLISAPRKTSAIPSACRTPSHPDVDAAMAEIIAVCRARSIPVGGTVGTANVAEKMEQGYRIISFGGANGGLSAQNEAVRTAAIAAGAKALGCRLQGKRQKDLAMTHPDNDEKVRWLSQETPETVLEPELPIIDPHHHLWRVPSPWGTYDLEDLWADTGSGHNVEQTVFIDARSGYRQDGPEHLKPIGESAFIATVAEQSAQATGKGHNRGNHQSRLHEAGRGCRGGTGRAPGSGKEASSVGSGARLISTTPGSSRVSMCWPG